MNIIDDIVAIFRLTEQLYEDIDTTRKEIPDIEDFLGHEVLYKDTQGDE